MRVVILAMIAATLTGCSGTARYVKKDTAEGIIAIPDSSNHWPYRYHDRAIEMIVQHVGPNYEILKEEEAVVGQRVSNDQNIDTETQPSILPWNQRQVQRVNNIETTRDMTEYRIHYRRKPIVMPAAAPPPPGAPR
jgi:hypothetical protein